MRPENGEEWRVGETVLAARMTHMPAMLMSERERRIKGKRQPAIDGHAEIARHAKALDAETAVIGDTHWVITLGFHSNAINRLEGLFTSYAFPQLIQNMPDEYNGNHALGDAMLYGALGWKACEAECRAVSPYLPSSGTGQTNVIFPV